MMLPARLTVLFVLFSFLHFLPGCKTPEHLEGFRENGLWGFKDKSTGRVVVPPIYTSYSDPKNPACLIVKGENAWGAINSKGDTVIPFVYDYLYTSYYNLICATRNKKSGYIDLKGREVIPVVYDNTVWFSSPVTEAKLNGKSGMINIKNETIIPFEYQDIHTQFTNGLAGARKNNKWGFIDSTNRVVIPFSYGEVDAFHEGLALVQGSNGKYGFINLKNDTVIPFIYEWPRSCSWETAAFHDGIAHVIKDGKSGYINTKGEVVIPLKYHCVKKFCDGFAPATISNGENRYNSSLRIEQFGYIDRNGNEFLIPYTPYHNYDWQVEKAPAIFPDFTDSLGFYVPKPPVNFFPSVMDGVYVREFPDQGKIDTARTDTAKTKVVPEKPEPPPQKLWTLEKMLNHSVNAFMDEPRSYPELCNLKEISVSYGLLIGGGNYSEDFVYHNRSGWDYFRKETIYKIIGSENMREAAWKWIAPYYKKAMQQMHPFHKQTYKDIAVYMKNYMNNYNRRQTENYLKRDEARFAHYDRNGNYDPYRKLSAFVDRLIIMHKVIDEKDACIWINRIADEVATW